MDFLDFGIKLTIFQKKRYGNAKMRGVLKENGKRNEGKRRNDGKGKRFFMWISALY